MNEHKAKRRGGPSRATLSTKRSLERTVEARPWLKYPSLPQEVIVNFSAVWRRGQRCSSSVALYNVAKNQWSTLPSLNIVSTIGLDPLPIDGRG